MDLEIGIRDVDFRFGKLGNDIDGREARLTLPLCIEGRNPRESVGSFFASEVSEREGSLDMQGYGVEPDF